MLERFVEQTSFVSQEDFKKHLKIHVPDNFNFGYDVLDEWAKEDPDKIALCWTNDKGGHVDIETPLRVLVLYYRIAQDRGGRHPRHPPSYEKGYSLPCQCRQHKNDSMCGGRGYHETCR